MSSFNNKKWYLSYDIARIIAIISVIFVHVSVIISIGMNPQTTEFCTGVILRILSITGVPIFLMISGALLLNEEKNFINKKFIKDSWLLLVLITVFWLIFYGIYYSYFIPISSNQPPSLDIFINYVTHFNGYFIPHMWYMYMIIGMYLLIPVLRIFVKKENKNIIKWLIIGSLIVQFIPKTLGIFTANADFTVQNFMAQFYLNPLTGYGSYFLIGWYLTTFPLSKSKRRLIYILGIISVIFLIGVSLAYINYIPELSSYLYDGDGIFGLLYAVAVFVLIVYHFGDKENKYPIIKKLSKFTFGIYIMHALFLEIFARFILPYSQFTLQIPILYALIIFAFTFAMSFITVLLVSKVKYLRKIFYLKN